MQYQLSIGHKLRYKSLLKHHQRTLLYTDIKFGDSKMFYIKFMGIRTSEMNIKM